MVGYLRPPGALRPPLSRASLEGPDRSPQTRRPRAACFPQVREPLWEGGQDQGQASCALWGTVRNVRGFAPCAYYPQYRSSMTPPQSLAPTPSPPSTREDAEPGNSLACGQHCVDARRRVLGGVRAVINMCFPRWLPVIAHHVQGRASSCVSKPPLPPMLQGCHGTGSDPKRRRRESRERRQRARKGGGHEQQQQTVHWSVQRLGAKSHPAETLIERRPCSQRGTPSLLDIQSRELETGGLDGDLDRPSEMRSICVCTVLAALPAIHAFAFAPLQPRVQPSTSLGCRVAAQRAAPSLASQSRPSIALRMAEGDEFDMSAFFAFVPSSTTPACNAVPRQFSQAQYQASRFDAVLRVDCAVRRIAVPFPQWPRP